MRGLLLALSLVVVALFAIASSASASVVFTGGFETNDLSQWDIQQSCLSGTPTRMQVYTHTSQSTWPTPVEGTHAVRFYVKPTDTNVCYNVPTDNPRAQLGTGKILVEGRDYWERWYVWFPSRAEFNPTGWHVFQETYGEPWSGPPSLSFGAGNGGDTMSLEREIRYNYDTVWSKPTPRGRWIKFVAHRFMSRNASSTTPGYIELWMDGVPQTFTNGSTHLKTATMHADASGAYRFFLNLYTQRGLAAPAITYFDGAKIGTTRADVDPTTTATPPTAGFTFSPASPVHGQTVTFTANQSGCNITPCTYKWEDDGPDGAGGTQYPLGTGATLAFTFQNAGTKHVRLTVTNGSGASATVEHDVVVS